VQFPQQSLIVHQLAIKNIKKVRNNKGIWVGGENI
jgi:hypothetical protein